MLRVDYKLSNGSNGSSPVGPLDSVVGVPGPKLFRLMRNPCSKFRISPPF